MNTFLSAVQTYNQVKTFELFNGFSKKVLHEVEVEGYEYRISKDKKTIFLLAKECPRVTFQVAGKQWKQTFWTRYRSDALTLCNLFSHGKKEGVTIGMNWMIHFGGLLIAVFYLLTR